jgi:hypothetical protein
MPLCALLQITELPRFRRILADYQLLAREQLICGMHVHVGIPDRDAAVRLMGPAVWCTRCANWMRDVFLPNHRQRSRASRWIRATRQGSSYSMTELFMN